jgi:voltage-gated potassium channel Kch
LVRAASALLLGLSAAGAAAIPSASAASTSQSGESCVGLAAQLLIAVVMMALTCTVHALVTVLQTELGRRPWLQGWSGPHSRRRLLLIVTMGLLTGCALLAEILLWALLYQSLGLFPSLEASLYFSGITFTTVGYGDMTLPHCWRLLSVSEAVNGVLMAGWSAAQLISVVQRMMELRLRSESAGTQDGQSAASPR